MTRLDGQRDPLAWRVYERAVAAIKAEAAATSRPSAAARQEIYEVLSQAPAIFAGARSAGASPFAAGRTRWPWCRSFGNGCGR
jgi:hypothetical protein